MLSITPPQTHAPGFAASDVTPVPLSERASGQLASSYVWAGNERDAILVAANDPATASDPAALYALQLRQEAYVKRVSVTSALASHFTKGVETLLKS